MVNGSLTVPNLKVKVKNELFSYKLSTEFLTAQQVASFFSRLAAKKTTDEDTEDDDEDEAHLQRENHLQEMRDNIVTSMSIQNAHPIVYDSFNICELVQV